MSRSKISRIVISAMLIICALWVAIPKVYIHDLFNHTHGLINNPLETSVQTEVKDDCEFDKYDSPVYFTIFKFINNLLPVKSKEQSYLNSSYRPFIEYTGENPSLRAPPIA
jgi:hypothetical protein